MPPDLLNTTENNGSADTNGSASGGGASGNNAGGDSNNANDENIAARVMSVDATTSSATNGNSDSGETQNSEQAISLPTAQQEQPAPEMTVRQQAEKLAMAAALVMGLPKDILDHAVNAAGNMVTGLSSAGMDFSKVVSTAIVSTTGDLAKNLGELPAQLAQAGKATLPDAVVRSMQG